MSFIILSFFFFFNETATTEIYTLSLHDALPISNPATPFERAKPFLPEIDLLLLMTVHPGFAGQAFRADVVPKIREARAYIDAEGLAVDLQVDGGIKVDTAPIVAEAGADILVSGSGIFPDHIKENLRAIRAAAEKTR